MVHHYIKFGTTIIKVPKNMIHTTPSGEVKIGLTLTPKGNISTRNKIKSILFEPSDNNNFEIIKGKEEKEPEKKLTKTEIKKQEKEKKIKQELEIKQKAEEAEKRKQQAKINKKQTEKYKPLINEAKTFEEKLKVFNSITKNVNDLANMPEISNWYNKFKINDYADYLTKKEFDKISEDISDDEINNIININLNSLTKKRKELYDMVLKDKKPSLGKLEEIKVLIAGLVGKRSRFMSDFPFDKSDKRNIALNVNALNVMINEIGKYIRKYNKLFDEKEGNEKPNKKKTEKKVEKKVEKEKEIEKPKSKPKIFKWSEYLKTDEDERLFESVLDFIKVWSYNNLKEMKNEGTLPDVIDNLKFSDKVPEFRDFDKKTLNNMIETIKAYDKS